MNDCLLGDTEGEPIQLYNYIASVARGMNTKG